MIELIDHIGEVELRVVSPTPEGLYAEALLGLARECLDGDPGQPDERRPVELRSSGPDTLLADLLNEAVYLMDADGFVASDLEDARVEGGALRGTLAGRREPGAPGESDGLHWPRSDGLIWPHLSRVVVSGKVAHPPGPGGARAAGEGAAAGAAGAGRRWGRGCAGALTREGPRGR